MKFLNGNVVIADPEWLDNATEGDTRLEQRDLKVLEAVEKTTAVFGLFFIDKYMLDISTELQTVYDQLQQFLSRWNQIFPWNMYYGISVDIVKTQQGMSYIVGSLCVDDNAEIEETFMVGILSQFTRELKNDKVFIRILDSEGDFLMADCFETVPEEYEYPIATNRLWLNSGHFIMIPKDIYYPSRGLTLDESIDFLERAFFKCVGISGVTNVLDTKYGEHFCDNFLKNTLCLVKITLRNKQYYEYLKQNPKLFTPILKNAYVLSASPTRVFAKHSTINETELFELALPTSSSYGNVLTMLLAPKNFSESSLSQSIGELVEKSLSDMMQNGDVDFTHECEEKNNGTISIDHTPEFKSLPSFEPNSEFIDNLKNEENTENLLNQLNTYLEKSQSQPPEDKTADNKKQQQSNEDDDEDEDEDEDDQARDYLNNENAGINEDDFFEFFLQNALNLKGKDLNQFRNMENTDAYDSECSESDTPLDDEEEGLEEMEALIQDLMKNDKIASSDRLNDLLASLQINGSMLGPLQNILENLNSEFND
ncbi:hypothetical protein ACO0QE_002395 [Hanseniaspora vineae]